MEFELAKKIAEVLASVDGYCPICSKEAAEEMMKVVPEFDWVTLVEEARRR